MPNIYSPRVINAVNYFLNRTGTSIVYKRQRKTGWTPTAITRQWWEWVTASAVIYGATDRDIESSGGRLRIGDMSFLMLNSIFTDLSGLSFIAFVSGSVEFIVGETITGAESGATGVVVSWYESAGTWAAGNAVGGVYVSGITDTFEDDENLNGSTGGSNISTTTAANVSTGSDDIYPEAGDEIVYSGTTYYVEITEAKQEMRQGAVVRDDLTRSTRTVWGRAKNV